jgi:hypothetical protein
MGPGRRPSLNGPSPHYNDSQLFERNPTAPNDAPPQGVHGRRWLISTSAFCWSGACRHGGKLPHSEIFRRPILWRSRSRLRAQSNGCNLSLAGETNLPVGRAIGELHRKEIIAGLGNASKRHRAQRTQACEEGVLASMISGASLPPQPATSDGSQERRF